MRLLSEIYELYAINQTSILVRCRETLLLARDFSRDEKSMKYTKITNTILPMIIFGEKVSLNLFKLDNNKNKLNL